MERGEGALSGTSRNVLITGGAGFIGTHLATHLANQGFHPIVFDNFSEFGLSKGTSGASSLKGVSFVRDDILDQSAVERAIQGSGYVLHLAAISDVAFGFKDPQTTFRVNCEGTMNVLEAARKADLDRLVMASSFTVYKGPPEKTPIPEDHPIAPPTPYGATKAFQDLMARAYHVSYGLPIVIFRMAPVFGPGQPPKSIVGFIRLALAGEAIEVEGGQQSRDWNYIDNCVHAFMQSVEGKGRDGEAYNIGGGEEVTVAGIVRKVIALTGSKSRIVTKPYRPGEGPNSRFCLDIAKARRELGYEVAVSFEEGLRRTIDWVRATPP